jgi:hypothetical protein
VVASPLLKIRVLFLSDGFPAGRGTVRARGDEPGATRSPAWCGVRSVLCAVCCAVCAVRGVRHGATPLMVAVGQARNALCCAREVNACPAAHRTPQWIQHCINRRRCPLCAADSGLADQSIMRSVEFNLSSTLHEQLRTPQAAVRWRSSALDDPAVRYEGSAAIPPRASSAVRRIPIEPGDRRA